MSFSSIQAFDTATTGGHSFTNPVSNNSCVIVLVYEESGMTVPSTITDDKSNTYRRLAVVTGFCGLFFLEGITNGPISFSAGNSVIAQEWSGAATASADDGAAIQKLTTSGTNSMTSGNFTPISNGDLILGIYSGFNLSGVSVGTGFTLSFNDDANANYSEYQVQATAGTIAAIFTPPSSDTAFIAGMAIKPFGGGAASGQPFVTPLIFM